MTIASALIIVGIIAGSCFVLYLLFVAVAGVVAWRAAKSISHDFDKGFDSDFFRRHR